MDTRHDVCAVELTAASIISGKERHCPGLTTEEIDVEQASSSLLPRQAPMLSKHPCQNMSCKATQPTVALDVMAGGGWRAKYSAFLQLQRCTGRRVQNCELLAVGTWLARFSSSLPPWPGRSAPRCAPHRCVLKPLFLSVLGCSDRAAVWGS